MIKKFENLVYLRSSSDVKLHRTMPKSSSASNSSSSMALLTVILRIFISHLKTSLWFSNFFRPPNLKLDFGLCRSDELISKKRFWAAVRGESSGPLSYGERVLMVSTQTTPWEGMGILVKLGRATKLKAL